MNDKANENRNYNKRLKAGGNPKYRLSEDEADIVFKYRRIKEEAEREGVDPKSIHSGWIKNKHASLYFKNNTFLIISVVL